MLDARRTITGGKLHGHVKSGTIPLPGVTVTAQNTLTGKRYSTTTDITGAWSLTIPQNGRYVIRTQFAAFAQGDQEAVLNASSHDQAVDFQLMLASRAAQQQQREDAQAGQASQAIRQLASSGAQSLNLVSALTGDTETQGGSAGASGAALPSIAGNSDFSDQSVADQRAVGLGESAGRRGYGSAARCNGDDARARWDRMAMGCRAADCLAAAALDGGGFGRAVSAEDLVADAEDLAVGAAISAASIPVSRTAQFSGWAATRR